MRSSPQPGSSTLRICAPDGHSVPATLESAGSDRIVIFSHGMTADRDEEGVHRDFAALLRDHGFDSIRFDFRGHGESTVPSREATISGKVLDFLAVVRRVRTLGYEHIFHVATSFGASITLLYAGRFSLSDFSAVAFWNPVIDFGRTFVDPRTEWTRRYFDEKTAEEMASSQETLISNGIVVGARMAAELLLLHPQATIWPPELPLLIIHGDGDTCVSWEDARGYQEKNRPAAQLLALAGVDHGFGPRLQEAFEATIAWFSILKQAGGLP